MRDERIPASIKSPLSLKADYANPRLYGGAGVIVGILSLVVGAVMLIAGQIGGSLSFKTGDYVGASFFLLLGAILFAVGYRTFTRAD